MQALAWWDWPMQDILAAEGDICGTDLDALEQFARHR